MQSFWLLGIRVWDSEFVRVVGSWSWACFKIRVVLRRMQDLSFPGFNRSFEVFGGLSILGLCGFVFEVYRI